MLYAETLFMKILILKLQVQDAKNNLQMAMEKIGVALSLETFTTRAQITEVIFHFKNQQNKTYSFSCLTYRSLTNSSVIFRVERPV